MNKILIIVGAIVLVGLGVGFFMFSGPAEPALTPTLTPQESPMGFPSSSPAVSPAATVSSAPRQHSVKIQNFAFVGGTLTVKRGDTVVFTNLDAAAHTATALNGAFDSGNLKQNQSFTLNTATFAAGTYQYRCTPHPAMTATLIVQ